MRKPSLSRPTACAALIALCACSGDDGSQPFSHLSDLDGGPVFLAQSEPATAVMEALFDGDVVLDDAGCLRLELTHPDGATVVWPYGATIEPVGDGFRVLGADGDAIGSVGGHFRFGGGFVSELHDGIAVTDEAREAATTRCPGNYWIVGEVP